MKAPDSILFGTGEYTTGLTASGQAKSDKSLGVVALTFFDLRTKGKVGDRIALVGTNAEKEPKIQEHFRENLTFTNIGSKEFEFFPKSGRDPKAYLSAIKAFKPGDLCTVFTPDDTHFEICKAALEGGLHVLVTKPMVKTLAQHKELVSIAKAKGVLLQIEVHKRFDPIYNDARQRIQSLGTFGYFTSFMSQPKMQLETFREWAGISSDISYYLNSHHVDFHVWAMQGIAKPVSVYATASTGVAEKILGRSCEDTITLTVTWKNSTGSSGHATYTSSWTASKSDVHSQQRFFCQMERAEVTVDQAHRGYYVAEDDVGFNSCNPLFIRNKPEEEEEEEAEAERRHRNEDSLGRYVGQGCYGYISFERFVEAATAITKGEAKPEDFNSELPTGYSTVQVTAILEAGRKSLDEKRVVSILYDDQGEVDKLD
ncbi:unnamed protein product [Durusdinium trenchii]|uniref:Gfo/Idh/MocA-like oxidoreductase N-terminal domain-containing protein n=1 Tax=Durusdinium trenchii TaxID=1381693 RepID=A0ABP0HEH2_9DINO